VTEKTALFNYPSFIVKLLMRIGFLVFLLPMAEKAKGGKRFVGRPPDKFAVDGLEHNIGFHLGKDIMTGKAAQFPFIEGKCLGHGFFHAFRKGDAHRVHIGARKLSRMTAVAELNGVAVKPERRLFALGIVFEVTFGTVFTGPVGIDYFLICFTGRSIG